jgi:hypothetical protein
MDISLRHQAICVCIPCGSCRMVSWLCSARLVVWLSSTTTSQSESKTARYAQHYQQQPSRGSSNDSSRWSWHALVPVQQPVLV